MGMAASQARYLQLTARKTNTEYEGQQINQERVVLANRTADLFNQMLMTKVPTCPDSNDFTKLQYSWTDGYNDAVISDYYQVSTADEEYNYVVTSYHYEDVYTGKRKVMNDPKVQADRQLEYDYSSTYNLNTIFNVESLLYNEKDDIYTIINEKRVQKNLERVLDGGDKRAELDSIYNRTEKAYANKLTEEREHQKRKAENISVFMLKFQKTGIIQEFNIDLWLSLIDVVTIHHNGKMVYKFLSGHTVEV